MSKLVLGFLALVFVGCGTDFSASSKHPWLEKPQKALKMGYDHVENEVNNCFQEDGCSIRGKRGNPGAPGAAGDTGAAGKDGADGANGKDGANGADGADGADGEDGAAGDDGMDGRDGLDGIDGEDGTSCALLREVLKCVDTGEFKVKYRLSIICNEDQAKIVDVWTDVSEEEFGAICGE